MMNSNGIDGQLDASIRDGHGRKIFVFKPNGGKNGNVVPGVLEMLTTLEEKYDVDWVKLLLARQEAARGRG
jgi:hypothetical protein